MQGSLLKWTNYLSGWQPRWFVLEKGVLSYYRCEEDIDKGSKGSLKLAVCDVSAHLTDACRIDLIIPGEQHFYLRAATAQERQRWLNALGSCKACLADGKPAMTMEEKADSDLRVKRSELRLYCDLILQQVYNIRSNLKENEAPNMETLNDATSMLSATCDTFVVTLHNCMELAGARAHSNSGTAAAKMHHAAPTRQSSQGKSGHTAPISMAAVGAGAAFAAPSSSTSSPLSLQFLANVGVGKESSRRPVVTDLSTGYEMTDDSLNHRPTQGSKSSHSPPFRVRTPPSQRKVLTFFSAMHTSFEDLRHLTYLEEESQRISDAIPTVPFLDACRSVIDIFDTFNATAFAPVRMDLCGNVRKLHQKYLSNPAANTCIQSMLLEEQQAKLHTNPNSASVATLWLSRTLHFISAMLEEILLLDGNKSEAAVASAAASEDICDAVTAAYARSLRVHHSWVIRGVVALAIKALPSRSDFLRKFFVGADFDESAQLQHGVSFTAFETALLRDMKHYAAAVSHVYNVLNRFLLLHNLNEATQPP